MSFLRDVGVRVVASLAVLAIVALGGSLLAWADSVMDWLLGLSVGGAVAGILALVLCLVPSRKRSTIPSETPHAALGAALVELRKRGRVILYWSRQPQAGAHRELLSVFDDWREDAGKVVASAFSKAKATWILSVPFEDHEGGWETCDHPSSYYLSRCMQACLDRLDEALGDYDRREGSS